MYTNSYKNMLYTSISFTCTNKHLLARRRLRDLVVCILSHDTQIQVAHALCKQWCLLISYTDNKRLVTIEACYNCPRSLQLKKVPMRNELLDLVPI